MERYVNLFLVFAVSFFPDVAMVRFIFSSRHAFVVSTESTLSRWAKAVACWRLQT